MKTTSTTMRDTLVSLLNDHGENPDIPAVRGKLDGSEADIDVIELSGSEAFRVVLSDGAKFRVKVEPLA